MSTRPQIPPHPVITNGAMAGDLTSLVTIIQKNSMLSYSFSWTGTTPIGDLYIQVSDDYELNPDGTVKVAGTWNNLPLSYLGASAASIPISGNSGNGLISIEQCPVYAIRAFYDATSGVGVMNAVVVGKVS